MFTSAISLRTSWTVLESPSSSAIARYSLIASCVSKYLLASNVEKLTLFILLFLV
ncbi:hypothetical protein HMPREF1579_00639 [Gardnerella vaginalis JCP8066]|nr:hypothetical protein HMPREF1579_00639 [Gardnerella vaginalis JCP8066]